MPACVVCDCAVLISCHCLLTCPLQFSTLKLSHTSSYIYISYLLPVLFVSGPVANLIIIILIIVWLLKTKNGKWIIFPFQFMRRLDSELLCEGSRLEIEYSYRFTSCAYIPCYGFSLCFKFFLLIFISHLDFSSSWIYFPARCNDVLKLVFPIIRTQEPQKRISPKWWFRSTSYLSLGWLTAEIDKLVSSV